MNITSTNCNFGQRIENADKMRKLAKDIVRMANCDHPMLVDYFERFVDLGIKYPTFAQMTLKNAEYDSYYKSAEEFVAGNISREEHLQRFKNTRGALSMLDKSKLGARLYNAMSEEAIASIKVPQSNKKAYQKAIKQAKSYVYKKIAVLSGISETSTQLTPCHVNKGIKKLTYRFLRLLNK